MIGNRISPFKFWCQKVLPTVYDDSLSYYEVLNKVTEFLNEVIEQMNTLTQNVEDYEENLTSEWDTYKTELNAEWLAYKNELTSVWEQYKSYIDNYFNNLNVQNEINNKLDEMASDGTLDALLLPYFNTYKTEINSIINNLTNDLSTLETRVDSLSHLAEGSTTGDAELIDIRTANASVTSDTYANAGDAVRGQAGVIEEHCVELLDFTNFDHLTYDNIVSGGYAYASKTSNAKRLRINNPIPVKVGMKFSISTATLKVFWGVVANLSASAYVEGNSWVDDATYFEHEIENNGYLIIALSKQDNTQDIEVTDYDGTLTISSVKYNPIMSNLLKGHGYTAKGSPTIIAMSDNTARCCLSRIELKQGQYFIKIPRGYCIIVFFTDEDNHYQSAYNHNTGNIEQEYVINADDTLLSAVKYAYIQFRNENNTAISSAEYETLVGNTYAKYIPYDNKQTLPYNISGKNLHIYRFNNVGNSWCFVRTPNNYDPNRIKPYPFVICNHGNGWVMNGTENYANWTKKTMYVPLTDPDYIAEPTQYNGTADSSLWYSNPTIEALLTAGYVVCGAENYGDSLYGNNNCRNACVAFFEHMIENYNVEKRCYMIGASNGAMTALNAAYLLQGKVKAIISQYGLTCLYNQYVNYTPHQADIRTAYGIPDSATAEQVKDYIKTHDPLTTDVVDDSVKVGTVPPVKFYYSLGDTVCDADVNSIALADLLNESGKVAEKRVCEGQHGDASHFVPSEYVSWFNNN